MSAAEKIDEPVKEEKKSELMPHRVQLAEAMRNVFFVTVPEDINREDLLNEKFWAHVSGAKQFKPYTKLEVATDDGRFYAEYLVMAAGNNYAVVKELCYHDLTEVNPSKVESKLSEFAVKYVGPSLRYCIVRKSDNERIKTQFQTEGEAVKALQEYIKVISK